MVTRAIERAQKQVEAQNFTVRKHLLEYDDVMNKQRENIYTLRRSLLEDTIHLDETEETTDAHGYLMALAGDVLDDIVERFVGAGMDVEEWDLPALQQEVIRVYGFEAEDLSGIEFDKLGAEEIRDALWTRIEKAHVDKEALLGSEFMRRVERDIMLQIVDQQWKDHLYSLDHLKEGIGLRGYGQRDPLVEYKRESFALFQDMKARIEDDIVRHLWHLRAMPSEEGAPPAPVRRPAPRRGPPLILNDPSATPSMFGGGAPAAVAEPANPFAPKPARVGGDDATVKTQRRDEPKVGRNDPCPCGSGKKYKKCHGVGA
jgi:preprotein translocase subunit SecA